MTKTLSEQICKLVGLKPRYKYTVKGKSLQLRLNKEDVVKMFKDRPISTIFKVRKVEKYFPDFENPENFVKLYELQINDETITELLRGYYPSNRKNFLTDLIDFIKALESLDSELSDKIKQSIRDYDGWVWG